MEPGTHEIAAFAMDASGELFLIDGVAQRLFGYDLRDLPGTNYLDFVVPEDRERALDVFQTVVTEQREAEVVLTALHKDGREIAVKVRAAPDRDDHSNVVGLVGTFEIVEG